jgi:hypothetical protein
MLWPVARANETCLVWIYVDFGVVSQVKFMNWASCIMYVFYDFIIMECARGSTSSERLDQALVLATALSAVSHAADTTPRSTQNHQLQPPHSLPGMPSMPKDTHFDSPLVFFCLSPSHILRHSKLSQSRCLSPSSSALQSPRHRQHRGQTPRVPSLPTHLDQSPRRSTSSLPSILFLVFPLLPMQQFSPLWTSL